jgi:hypothetical protein
VPREALSGMGAMHHHRTLRRHSQEDFPLTPKKRPGPLKIRMRIVCASSRYFLKPVGFGFVIFFF